MVVARQSTRSSCWLSDGRADGSALSAALHRTPNRSIWDYYMAEFAFRYNRRTASQHGLVFYRLMEATLAHGQVTQGAIVSHR